MKAYYTSIYCNEDGAGEVLRHKTAEAAREYLNGIWEHLTDTIYANFWSTKRTEWRSRTSSRPKTNKTNLDPERFRVFSFCPELP